MSPTSLVTGASGFMGSHMVELLLASGHQVRATDLPVERGADDPRRGRYTSHLKKSGVEFVPADLSQAGAHAGLVKGVDYIFHIAGIFSYTAPRELLYRVNVEGTRQLLDAVVQNGSVKKLILWAAGGIYGVPKPSELPIREDSPKRPPNAYIQSKLDQEQLTHQYFEREKLPYSSIRPTGVYGPRAVYGMGKLMIQMAGMKKIRLPKCLDGRMPLVHAVDVCRSALFLSQRDDTNGQAYNLVDDYSYTNLELFQILAQLLGKPFAPIPLMPKWLVKAGAHTAAFLENFFSKYILRRPPKVEKDTLFFIGPDFWYTNEKLKNTGFEFKYSDSKAGLAETIRWYRDNKLI